MFMVNLQIEIDLLNLTLVAVVKKDTIVKGLASPCA